MRKFVRCAQLRAFVVGLAMCIWDNALADWQGTVWNSTVDQAAKDFRVPHRQPTHNEIFNWSANPSGEIKIAFDYYSVGDLVFHKGALLFKDGKLSRIAMALQDADVLCGKLVEILRLTYGLPAREEQSQFDQIVSWHDVKNRNLVEVHYHDFFPLQGINDCDLDYWPFILPMPGQL